MSNHITIGHFGTVLHVYSLLWWPLFSSDVFSCTCNNQPERK